MCRSTIGLLYADLSAIKHFPAAWKAERRSIKLPLTSEDIFTSIVSLHNIWKCVYLTVYAWTAKPTWISCMFFTSPVECYFDKESSAEEAFDMFILSSPPGSLRLLIDTQRKSKVMTLALGTPEPATQWVWDWKYRAWHLLKHRSPEALTW